MRCDTHVRQVCRWNSLKIGMIYMILIPVWNLWLEIFVWEGDREGLNSLVKAHLDLVHDLSFKSPTFFLQIRNHFLKFLRWQIQIIGISDLSVKSTIAEREADIHFIDDWSSAFNTKIPCIMLLMIGPEEKSCLEKITLCEDYGIILCQDRSAKKFFFEKCDSSRCWSTDFGQVMGVLK